jgi:hypothetical protein
MVIVKATKSHDDVIDSGIAFLTAVSCAVDHYYEWGDGTDGTSVGPGMLG